MNPAENPEISCNMLQFVENNVKAMEKPGSDGSERLTRYSIGDVIAYTEFSLNVL